jgi:arginase
MKPVERGRDAEAIIEREANVAAANTKKNVAQRTEKVVLASSGHGQCKVGVELAPERLLTFCTFGKESIIDPALLSAIDKRIASNDRVQIQCNTVPILRPSAVGKINAALHESIFGNVMKCVEMGTLPKILTLGGDHSIAIGSISALSRVMEEVIKRGVKTRFKRPELIVFWIDAHADINTPRVTTSGRLHGCPVSLLAGLDKDSWNELPSFDWATKELTAVSGERSEFIQTSRLVYIGLRDVDPPEQDIIDKHKICEYPMTRFKREGRNITKTIVNALEMVDPTGEHPIHISFDIDAIDPQYAASTGTPVPDGLKVQEGEAIIKALAATGRLVSMDLVEVNPSLGTVEQIGSTLKSATKLIEAFTRNDIN